MDDDWKGESLIKGTKAAGRLGPRSDLSLKHVTKKQLKLLKRKRNAVYNERRKKKTP